VIKITCFFLTWKITVEKAEENAGCKTLSPTVVQSVQPSY